MIIPLRYIALIFVLITTPLLVWSTVYLPANQAVEDVANEIRTRTKRLKNISQINRQYREMQAAISEIDNAMVIATSRVPVKHQAEQWLGEASSAAESLGLVVRSVTIAGSHAENKYSVLPVNMEVTGSFSGFYELIQHFEQMDRFLPIHHLDVRRVNDSVVDATMVIHLIFDEGEVP